MDKKQVVAYFVLFGFLALWLVIQTRHQKALQEHKEKKLAFERYQASLKKPLQIGPDGAVPGSGTQPQAVVSAALQEFQKRISGQPKAPIPFASPTLQGKLSVEGGTFDWLGFTEIKESTFRPVEHGARDVGPFVPVHLYDKGIRSFALTANGAEPGLEKAEWLHVELPAKAHRFERLLPPGDLLLAKELHPGGEKDPYTLKIRVVVENRSGESRRLGYTLGGAAGMLEENLARSAGVEAVLALKDKQGGVQVTVTPAAGIAQKKATAQVQSGTSNRVAFYGLRTKYFACLVVPQGERQTVETLKAVPLLEAAGRKPKPEDLRPEEDATANQAIVQGIVPDFTISAGEKVEHEYVVYCGPRSEEVLEQASWKESGLDHNIEWGSPEFLSRFLTWILKGFHSITRNWGAAIICLTFLVRALIHPISYRGQKNMQKMQKIQPEMQKLKEKFEDKDGQMTPEGQREFTKAYLALYSKHGVNPVGCLGPMFLQIPVFIALYGAVSHVYELRQQSFLWIKDLSEPDVIFRLPWAIFVPHGTNAVSLLPIVMIIVYWFQMKMQPPPTDPKQADTQKMMQWMMPAMGYMFWTMPSGLLLYFVTSAVLGMIEQKWVKARLARIEAEATAVPAPT